MSYQRHKNNFAAAAGRQQPRIRLMRSLAVLVGLIIVIAIVAGVLFHSSGRKADYEKLIGKWVRPDGGYVISIHNIDSRGQVQAAYFNPNPINVSKAMATSEVGKIKLFVELRDVGYPGSKYNLTYNPREDMLQGTYFQAQIQQLYQVFFRRMK